MNITVKTTIRDNRIPSIIGKFPGEVSAAVRITALEIETTAKQLCPVAKVAGGTLRRSILADTQEFSATIAPHTEYAAYVEFGTRKMAAQPYMLPAADMNEPKYVERIDQIVKLM